MAQFSLLASTLLMGALVVAAALGIRAVGQQRTHVGATVGQPAGAMQRVAGSPIAWTVGFLVLVVAGLGSALLYATGTSVAPAVPQMWLVGVLVGVVVLYLLWGVYHSARYRGFQPPAAIATAAWLVGTLVVAVITLQLLGFL